MIKLLSQGWQLLRVSEECLGLHISNILLVLCLFCNFRDDFQLGHVILATADGHTQLEVLR